MKLIPVTQLHMQPQGDINSLWKIDHATKHVNISLHSIIVINEQMHSYTAFNYYLQH